MNSKIYIFIGIFLITLVSAAVDLDRDITVQDRLRDEGLKERLRSVDTVDDCKGILFSRTCRSYNTSAKRVLIENWRGKDLFDAELEFEYKRGIGCCNDSEIARFKPYEIDRSNNDLIENTKVYDPKYNYRNSLKELTWEYGYEVEIFNREDECFLEDEEGGDKFIIVCENSTKINWTVFTDVSQIPEKMPDHIRIKTDVVMGETGEWVIEIGNQEILEWAEYIVSFGPVVEFEFVRAKYNNLVHLANDTFYANIHSGSNNDGFATLFRINTTTMVVEILTVFEWQPVRANDLSSIRLEEFEENVTDVAHTFSPYADATNDLRGVILEFNLTAETIVVLEDVVIGGTGTSNIDDTSMVRADVDKYMFVFKGAGNDGFVIVVHINQTTFEYINDFPTFEFDTIQARENFLVKMNDTLYVVFYQSSSVDGYAVVLFLNRASWIASKPSVRFEFDNTQGTGNQAVSLNESIAINSWDGAGVNNFCQAFNIQVNGTITPLGIPTISCGNAGGRASTTLNDGGTFLKVNKTRYVLTSRTGLGNAQFKVVDLNLTTWNFTTIVTGEYVGDYHQALIQIGDNTEVPLFWLNSYECEDEDGCIGIIQFDETSCIPPISGTWNIDCSHRCRLNETELIIPGNISVTGFGEVRFNGSIFMNSIRPHIEVEKDICTFKILKGVEFKALK